LIALKHFFLLHEHQNHWRMQQGAEPVRHVLHHGRDIWQAMKRARHFDENARPAALVARETIQA